MDDSKDLLKYVLTGAIGFLLGVFFYYLKLPEYSKDNLMANRLGYAVFGVVLCGLFLGIASKDIIKGIRLAIGGFLGFVIGTILSYPIFLLSLMLAGNGNEDVGLFIFLVLVGSIGGVFMGIALFNLRKILIFWIAAGLGFSLWFYLGMWISDTASFSFVILSIIPGASLGAGMYYAEKSYGVEKSE
jgi:hypothetical protein